MIVKENKKEMLDVLVTHLFKAIHSDEHVLLAN
jgi:hypothetical protein